MLIYNVFYYIKLVSFLFTIEGLIAYWKTGIFECGGKSSNVYLWNKYVGYIYVCICVYREKSKTCKLINIDFKWCLSISAFCVCLQNFVFILYW